MTLKFKGSFPGTQLGCGVEVTLSSTVQMTQRAQLIHSEWMTGDIKDTIVGPIPTPNCPVMATTINDVVQMEPLK